MSVVVKVDVAVPVIAEFTKMPGDPIEFREVKLAVSRIDPKYGPVVKMYGGPTGFESFYAEDFFNHAAPFGDDLSWVACGGHDGRWARCFVPDKAMRYVFAELGLS